jgi:hypothetical protein
MMNVHTLSILFLGLVLLMATALIQLFRRFLDGGVRMRASAALVGWLLYVGVMGYTGAVASRAGAGPLFLVLPVMLFIALFLTRHPGVRTFASRIPTTWLVGLQSFRVLVEGALYGLYSLGFVPRLLTFEGGNLDILMGLSAPVVAWLYAAGRIDGKAVRLWNWIGIGMLANIVGRAFLTAPGPFHLLATDVPNRAMGLFPFNFLPGFLAPLALSLHVLALRSVPNARPAPAGGAPDAARLSA